jgi:uncharacterized protein YndB with AHSA1/START domain
MIKVSTLIQKPLSEVWEKFNCPEDIVQWYHASEDWRAPAAVVNLKVGGTFTTKMASKDGKFSFDLSGTYTKIIENECVEFSLEDGRKVKVSFTETSEGVQVTEEFEPETTNPAKVQQEGWQAILDNFRLHCSK